MTTAETPSTNALTVDQALQQASAFHQAGDLTGAERLYRAIIREFPKHPVANHLLGALAVQLQQPALALPHFKVALENNPNQQQYWISYIDALIEVDQLDTAAQVLRLGRERGLQGETVEALARRLESTDPPSVTGPTSEEMNRLISLFNQGRYAEVEFPARLMTQLFPEHGFGWKLLGAGLKAQGRSAEALGPMQQAAILSPGDADAHSNLGVTLKNLGRLKDAEASYRRALEIQPDYADAHINLGVTLKAQGRLEEAEASYRRALEIKPDFSEAHSNLGSTLKDQGRLEEAEASYRRALEIKPDFAEAHGNLGNALKDQGRLEEAEASQRRALEIKPDFAEAHGYLGVILKDQGRLVEAEASCRRAVEIKPDFAEAHSNLGNTLKDQGRLVEAEASYRRAVGIKPDFAEAHSNLGNTLKDQNRLEEAEASYRRALKIRPNFAQGHSNLGNALRDQGRLEEAEACYRRALEIKPDYPEALGNLLFCFGYSNSCTTSFALEEARRYGRLVAHMTGGAFADWSCETEPERLRVGLVSGDLRNHPVGYFLENLLAQIDRSRVELVAFPTLAKTDKLTSRIKPYFVSWKPLYGLNDQAAAQLIRSEAIHVLIDLSGHTGHNRLPVFARKPAPVQVTWMGYVATTGVAEMDYLLADEVRVPKEHQEHFTETVWYLPDTRLCFTPPDVDLAVQPLPALANGYLTFACFQNLTKVSDSVIKAWGLILAALPTARMRLQCKQFADDFIKGQIADRFKANGVDTARVTMFGPAAREAYLAAYAEVDMNLDTFPFPGTTTTCEAIWLGVPTLTLAGDRMAARNGASVMTAAGLADWVATSEADYVAKAIAMASDLPKLAALRAGLRAQALASPLFDSVRFARNLETALWGMWRHWSDKTSGEVTR